jgi:hypothetical protein
MKKIIMSELEKKNIRCFEHQDKISNYGNKTIECPCGYIATFERWSWTCPNCGRTWQATNGHIIQTGMPANEKEMK